MPATKTFICEKCEGIMDEIPEGTVRKSDGLHYRVWRCRNCKRNVGVQVFDGELRDD